MLKSGLVGLGKQGRPALTLPHLSHKLVLAVLGQAMAWTIVQYGSVRRDTTVVAGLLLLSPVATVAIIAPVLFSEIPRFCRSSV